VARLKSSADMVAAIEPAVRLYEERPTQTMTVETHWGDIGSPPPTGPRRSTRRRLAPRTTRHATRSGTSCWRA
jgi:hypothetical protein